MNAEELIRGMTLEEKAGLCSGKDQWHTRDIPRLGVPAARLSDGPHGIRYVQRDGSSREMICYPTGSALGASFDPELAEEIGHALGVSAREADVNTVLGPAVNMKRSPLCGRNFEYLSEDPFAAGEIGAALVRGIQAEGVAACPKHFAANNQEYRRMSVSAEVDERTLREIYLNAFERIVRKASPWAMMCSYNRINGVYSCENEWLLNQVLRREWGYDGIVMTDWAAMDERVAALKAGLELEMPSSYGQNDRKIVRAVKNGTLPAETLDEAVRRLLTWIGRSTAGTAGEGADSEETGRKNRELARKAAGECAVLLENNGMLPLKPGSRIAFIGGFAEKPRFQGGGSSRVNARVVSALESARAETEILYAEGFSTVDDIPDEKKLAEAVRIAKAAEAAVIFAGLPDSFEAEGKDRTTLAIPECQNRLIEAVCEAQPNTAVVFHAGSPVLLPWRRKAAALLFMYLGGQGTGEAAVDLLFGKKNPSGRLAETFPLRLEDTPCWLDFPGTDDEVRYSEGVYIGYRWYDKRKMEVEYPFGYGLSYTDFEYADLRLSGESMKDTEELTVRVKVRNTGDRKGKEVVQLYVEPDPAGGTPRPVREMKGFVKLELEPGEEKEAVFTLDKRSFACYSKRLGGWYAESGTYTVCIGKSSAEILLRAQVRVESTDRLPVRFTNHMTVGDLRNSGLQVEQTMDLIGIERVGMEGIGLAGDAARLKHLNEVRNGMPIHAVVSMDVRDMKAIYQSIREIDGLEGKECIPEE